MDLGTKAIVDWASRVAGRQTIYGLINERDERIKQLTIDRDSTEAALEKMAKRVEVAEKLLNLLRDRCPISVWNTNRSAADLIVVHVTFNTRAKADQFTKALDDLDKGALG